jgi:capsid protein
MASLGRGLFIATANAVHLRSQRDETLFEAADGIANARASKDNSSLFAIADDQVVILHDVARAKDRKYKLKKGDVWHVGLVASTETDINTGRTASPTLLS